MTYRAGTHGLAKHGLPDSEPRITCDICGLVHRVERASGLPYAWFLAGKAPPRWRRAQRDCLRVDYCPACKESPVAT